jgi:hypothetical protein
MIDFLEFMEVIGCFEASVKIDLNSIFSRIFFRLALAI